jgi:hypothetical protein
MVIYSIIKQPSIKLLCTVQTVKFGSNLLVICRRKGGVTPAGGDTEDPLGLDVEGEASFPEDQLQVNKFI